MHMEQVYTSCDRITSDKKFGCDESIERIANESIGNHIPGPRSTSIDVKRQQTILRDLQAQNDQAYDRKLIYKGGHGQSSDA